MVTGGSKGLGAELIRVFSSKFRTINISRSNCIADKTLNIDLFDLNALTSELNNLNEKIHLCILNAGTLGSIEKANVVAYQDFQRSLTVNLIANKVIIDIALKKGCKKFLAISSGAAIKNYDGWLEYCVSKAALRSMILQYQKTCQTQFFV